MFILSAYYREAGDFYDTCRVEALCKTHIETRTDKVIAVKSKGIVKSKACYNRRFFIYLYIALLSGSHSNQKCFMFHFRHLFQAE